MPIVEVNGQELEFPDDMHPEDIKAVLRKKFPIEQQSEAMPTPEEKGFFGKVAEDMRSRGAELANAAYAAQTGQQSDAERAFQQIGTEFGAFGDILGQGISSAAQTGYETLVPDAAQQSLSSIGKSIAGSDIGQAVGQLLQQAGENQATFERLNPRAARNLEAYTNIASMVTPIPGIGKSVSGATKDIAKSAKTSIKGLAKEAITPLSSDEIKTMASGFYKQAAEKGGILKPKFTNNFIEKIQKLKPQTEIGKVIGGDSPFSKMVDKISEIKDMPISLESAQEMDELLGDAIDSFVENGKLTKQGKKLFDIQSEFRNMIENATPDMIEGTKEGFDALKKGRKLWSASRRAGDIERIIARAESMDNPATAIKSGFRTLAHNPSRMRGFTTQERALIRKAAESGVVSDLLRTAGSRLLPIITGATGGGFAGTTAATAASIASRGAANKMQLNKANKILQEITKSTGKK